jgi:hypothetical protein
MIYIYQRGVTTCSTKNLWRQFFIVQGSSHALCTCDLALHTCVILFYTLTKYSYVLSKLIDLVQVMHGRESAITYTWSAQPRFTNDYLLQRRRCVELFFFCLRVEDVGVLQLDAIFSENCTKASNVGNYSTQLLNSQCPVRSADRPYHLYKRSFWLIKIQQNCFLKFRCRLRRTRTPNIDVKIPRSWTSLCTLNTKQCLPYLGTVFLQIFADVSSLEDMLNLHVHVHCIATWSTYNAHKHLENVVITSIGVVQETILYLGSPLPAFPETL